jgi:hypothetical protein
MIFFLCVFWSCNKIQITVEPPRNEYKYVLQSIALWADPERRIAHICALQLKESANFRGSAVKVV